jgi:hypothetical protein
MHDMLHMDSVRKHSCSVEKKKSYTAGKEGEKGAGPGECILA